MAEQMRELTAEQQARVAKVTELFGVLLMEIAERGHWVRFEESLNERGGLGELRFVVVAQLPPPLKRRRFWRPEISAAQK